MTPNLRLVKIKGFIELSLWQRAHELKMLVYKDLEIAKVGTFWHGLTTAEGVSLRSGQ